MNSAEDMFFIGGKIDVVGPAPHNVTSFSNVHLRRVSRAGCDNHDYHIQHLRICLKFTYDGEFGEVFMSTAQIE